MANPKLLMTDNYDIFEVTHFNRDIKRTKELERSMTKFGYIAAYPIHCIRVASGKLHIKGGNHRLFVAKKLGIAVCYVVSEDTATILELEQSTSPWKLEDYLTSHVRSGDADSITIKEYCDRTGVTIGQAISMFGGESATSNNLANKFKQGLFELKDSKLAEDVGVVVLGLKASGVTFAANNQLVNAICLCTWLEEFNPDVFINRVQSNKVPFHKCATAQQYLELIESIYNYGARNKVNLAFMAREAAKKRNATSKGRKVQASID